MRKLNRTAEHRACLLRNLVTNVLEHNSIITTHSKAKEVQYTLEHAINHARRIQQLTDKQRIFQAKQRLEQMLYKPKETMPRLEEVARRRINYDSGHTRIMKLEPRLGDNAPQSIIELVDGKYDMCRSLTAKAVARSRDTGELLPHFIRQHEERYSSTPESKEAFEAEVAQMQKMFTEHENIRNNAPQKRRKAPIMLVDNPYEY
ncbi:mitochondrial 54S ribosomal protein YmL8 [Starmerella bacillaris]|uniref:Mitochondrial 54S ribosomal protein YmL8 n=1 Tax=Starmerella bacillaris TaxID=1247836 RepID=A0AAV5RF04_STABA|nr:mitochondrial 54S ribosomal protein YmL8 [Starmerella bacillaris]